MDADVVFVDFEGEPRRSLAERRAKQSPLVDVAGIVRSLDYAAEAALRTLCTADADTYRRALPVFAAWRRTATTTFRVAYHATAGESGAYPGENVADALLAHFCLEKVLYEVRYELDSRLDWVSIPLHGLARFIDDGGDDVA